VSENRRSDGHKLPELPAILATCLARYQHTMLLGVATGYLKTGRSCAGSKIMQAIDYMDGSLLQPFKQRTMVTRACVHISMSVSRGSDHINQLLEVQ
jgi:hypothetical protein